MNRTEPAMPDVKEHLVKRGAPLKIGVRTGNMEDMSQQPLFPEHQRIVNVASVPQRSPFRYPGGKTWLVPRIRQWLLYRTPRPSEFLEPFAGGGIVSLTVAFEKLAGQVTMVELDEHLAA